MRYGLVAEVPDAIVLSVEDRGPGMPSAAVAMLTGNGDRAAPIGRGSGLGLWMTNRLVRELRGSVSVDGGYGGVGMLVTVSIPKLKTKELAHVA